MGNNIEYIISAEFHIDKGPSIIDQYPRNADVLNELEFLPELMIPDQIHKREEDYTLFLLYRNKNTGKFQYLYNSESCEPDPYYLYTIVSNMKDSSFKRGSRIKSVSIITRLLYFKNFKPLLLICLDAYFDSNNIKYLKELYEGINVKNFSIGKNMSIIKKLLVTSILDLPINDKIYYDEKFRQKLLGLKEDMKNSDLFIRKDLSFNSIVSFNKMNIPIKVPMIDLPDTIGDYLNPTDMNFKPNLINILQARLATNLYNNELTIYGLSTPPIIILINAFLTGKKIIFLSYDNSSGYIIDHILLALKIITGGGILGNILLKYNVFPIMDVSKIDLLEQCDSYIAGTINPFFKNNDKLWDLLYDLDSNEIHLSTQIGLEDSGNQTMKSSIISEDAKFLSNLQLSIFNYNDDLTTIQLIFRRHINEIIRILLSSKNFNDNLSPRKNELTLLMDGIGYYWNSDTNKLLEMSCYQLISKKFQDLLYNGKFSYNLMLPNLANELNLMMDLQYQIQSLNSNSSISKSKEREIWFNILKFLISGKSLEIFLLITYLIPPNSASSLQSSSLHGGNLTIFDKNKGIELLLINLFNIDNQVKSNVIMIVQEFRDHFLCGWCINNYLQSNVIYNIAFNELLND